VDTRIAYLGMIQAIIIRMAGSSFMLKGWSVTLVAALFALAAADTNQAYVYLAYFPAFMFWGLDAYFLRQERLFRALYDHVRVLPDAELKFSMDTTPFVGGVGGIGSVAMSPTLLAFHGTMTGVLVVVILVVKFA